MMRCANSSLIALFCCLFIRDAAAQSSAAIGVTRKGTEIPVILSPKAANLEGGRVLVIGGHDGKRASVKLVEDLVTLIAKSDASVRGPESATYIPNVYPDGVSEIVVAGESVRGYPPDKGFYEHATRPESRYLWRWVAMYGPDLVIDIRSGKSSGYWLGGKGRTIDALRPSLARLWSKLPRPEADDFCLKLSEEGIADLGTAPCLLLQIAEGTEEQDFTNIAAALRLAQFVEASPTHRELKRREEASTREVALDLALTYGKEMKQVAYIPALAVIGRVRVTEMLAKEPPVDHTKNPFAGVLYSLLFTQNRTHFSGFLSGFENPLPKNGSEQAGHLLFAELAKRSEGKERERWIELCKAAADQVFDKDGKPQPLMPYHNEMSDAVFMATPILSATGKLTGEKKYFDAAVTHFRSMKRLCLRDDGLYRHSPLDEAAWGRGNGFPAMGLAWALSEFSEDHSDFPELKKDFQNHITALLKHQDVFGCWHQVIDKPGSYREFSATCMIAWAMKRGMDRGWLTKEQCEKPLERAWIAAKQRIGPKGVVVDICTGTGKQKSLRDYYDRPAIWGVDARGGAMALMLATEMVEK